MSWNPVDDCVTVRAVDPSFGGFLDVLRMIYDLWLSSRKLIVLERVRATLGGFPVDIDLRLSE